MRARDFHSIGADFMYYTFKIDQSDSVNHISLAFEFCRTEDTIARAIH